MFLFCFCRWKGENVATTEVSEVLNKFPSIMETNVYGVQVAGKNKSTACLAHKNFKGIL